MKYTPDYQIKTESGLIPLLFNSWTFRQYCAQKGVEYEDLIDNVKEGKAFRSADLPELFLTAASSFQKFNGQESTYTEINSYEWIDEMGGFNSTDLLEVYKVFVGKLLNVSPENLNALWNKAVEDSKEPKDEHKKKIKKVA